MRKNILRAALCLIATATLLSACHPHHPHHPHGARISVPGVDVRIGDDGGYRGGPGHCPPGHRKKGWC